MSVIVEKRGKIHITRPNLRTFRRPLILLPALLAVALCLGAAYVAGTQPETATVARQDITAYLPLGSGPVVAPPTARADVAAPFRAPVAAVYASVGQRVEQGDTLVELADATAQAAYERARREVREAEAALRSGERRHGRLVALAEKRLARAAERAAQAALTPPVTLIDPQQGPVTVQERRVDPVQASASRESAEWALLEAQIARDNALYPLRERLEAARTRLAEAERGRKRALVRAPISGTVLALDARPGQEVGGEGQSPVATIVDLEKLQVHARVKPEQLASVKPGLPAAMTFDRLPGESFTGRVERITSEPASPGPLGKPRYMAIITLRNPQGLVKPEMTARAQVQIGQAKDAVAVPSGAVERDRTGRPVVTVLRDGAWRQVAVETGLRDGRFMQIKSGLREGETIRVTRKLF